MMDAPAEYYFIVVTGPFFSGKSTFVASAGATLSEKEILFPKTSDNTDVLWHVTHYGSHLKTDQETLYIVATPNGRRFDFMWETLAHGHMIGFIVILDSRKPREIHEAKSILETFAAYAPVPYIVAANFQDHPDAWDADSLRHLMRLPDEIPVLPCVATDKESVKKVLIALLEKVVEAIDADDETETTA